MVRPTEEIAAGLEFELLESYPFCVALPPRHQLTKLKQVPIALLVYEPLMTPRQSGFSDYFRMVLLMLAGLEAQPRIVAECDSGSSVFTEVQAGHGLALVPGGLSPYPRQKAGAASAHSTKLAELGHRRRPCDQRGT